MEWLTLDGIPWLGVALAFVATFVLGWFWYSPQGFGGAGDGNRTRVISLED